MRLALLVVGTTLAFGGTRIVGPLTTPDGRSANVECSIALSTPADTPTESLVAWRHTIRVVRGAIDVTLAPNDTMVPSGTSYELRCSEPGGEKWTEFWVVPTSAVSLRVRTVRVSRVPSPEMAVLPQQIKQGGATAGQYLGWNGTAWRPTTFEATGITSLNGQTGQAQSLATSALGTDFAITSSGDTHTFAIPSASGTARGLLTPSDWLRFDAQNALQVQGRSVATTAPSDGQALRWNDAASQWEPGAIATMAADLGDLAVERTSPTVLTIGRRCSTATPCNVRFGNTSYSITNSCTATISAGTGTARIYVASGGYVTISHNLTVTASIGCATASGAIAFPSSSIPLYTWTATSGTWDETGGSDRRAVLSTKNIVAGTGLAVTELNGHATISIIDGMVPLMFGTPTDGQMLRWSADYEVWVPVKVRHTVSFAAQTSVTVLGTVHQLGTADLTITCYDASNNLVEGDGWTVNASTYDVTIRFTNPQSGRCVLR